ncbi:hypothetical protein K501DRAFT_337447 [Backusella circina FSU 941]|nr:hypothetical protein K501DRAFT_337447 [Backusella circina FSU 941]
MNDNVTNNSMTRSGGWKYKSHSLELETKKKKKSNIVLASVWKGENERVGVILGNGKYKTGYTHGSRQRVSAASDPNGLTARSYYISPKATQNRPRLTLGGDSCFVHREGIGPLQKKIFDSVKKVMHLKKVCELAGRNASAATAAFLKTKTKTKTYNAMQANI